MKKVIIGLSGIVLVAFVIIMVSNAQTGTKEGKKSATEMSDRSSKCPSATGCGKMTEAIACDPAKCKEMGCDPAKCKEGKCDPATCKATCEKAKGEMKKCPAMCCVNAKK